jgi:hypothetical protein
MLGAMARVAPPQPSKAIARIALRFLVPQPNTHSFSCPQLRVDSFGVDSRFETARSSSAVHFFGLDSKFFSKIRIDSKRGLAKMLGAHCQSPRPTEFDNFAFSPVAVSA